jgi:hypothetical protein
MLTWTGLLLAGTLYIVGVFGPLRPFVPSATSWLMLEYQHTDARAQDTRGEPKPRGIAAELDAFAFARIC